MRKLIFTAALFIAAFAVKAQISRVNTKTLFSKDSFNLDGVWRKTFPGANAGDVYSGGVVTWLTGLTFAVTAAEYQIKNKVYRSNSGTITLDASHPTLPRIDVIGLNTSGQIIKVTGTAASTPAIPQINPATQLYLTAVFIGAGATAPGGVTTTTIYNENTEWTADGNTFPTINFAGTANPQTGTVAIDVTGTNATNDVSASGGFKMSNGATVYNYSDYTALRFYIRLKSAWVANNASLQIGLGNGGEQLLNITTAHGFNPSLVGSYQNISIPISDIPKTSNSFSVFYFIVTGNGKGFYLDNIQLQGGIGGGNGSGYVTNVYKKAGTDSVFQVINGIHLFAYLDTGTGGGGGGSITLNGQTGATQTFATGTTGTNFSIISSANTHTFNIPDASGTNRGLVTTGTQLFAGAKEFSSNLLIRGVTFGNGNLNNVSNTATGANALISTITGGVNNTAYGNAALRSVTTGNGNVASGANAQYSNITGLYNTSLGYESLYSNTASWTNTAIGSGALYQTTGGGNVGIGAGAGWGLTTGERNINIYARSTPNTSSFPTASGVTNGNGNVFIGGMPIGGLGLAGATSNNIILLDGDGVKRLHITDAGIPTFYGGKLTGDAVYAATNDNHYLQLKNLRDSAFTIDTSLTAAVNILQPVSSTLLQGRGLANSATVTWHYNGNGDVVATAAGGGGGTFSGSIAANQIAFGTAANTLGGDNNLYTNGSALSIGTTDLSKSFQILTASGGDAFKLHSTDANCDIVGSSSSSAFEGSNRIRFNDGFTFITSATDAMKVKQNQNVKFFGGVEFAGKQDITTGTATTIADNVYNIFVDPASVLATHTITLPAAPAEGQEINIFFGGTIASGAAVVTSLTISPNAGQTLYGAAITTANGGDVITYVYNDVTDRWHRKK